MGTFHYPIEVGTPDGSTYEMIEPRVDTGASHTVLPASLLTRLGVSRDERWPFTLADDRMVEMDVGHTQVPIDGRSVTTIVVFGDEGAMALLGATTLEELRLGVDPVSKRLIPVPGLLM